MQAEMNELFTEGGVMQEGGTVDPVSGNDVPVGSMQEEVRDDIPAQLSEGEFVVPADVVRYIGLENLMAMRDKAKAGLKRMEEIGQMGNAEEVDDAEALFGDDMDDNTFSSEIDSIMNDGGEQEYAAGGDVRKYAPGGYVGGAENEQLYRDAPIKGFEMVHMTNDAGQTLFIPFINGVAQLNVPDGYRVKKSGTVDTPPVTAPVESAPTQDSGGGGGADSGGGGGADSDGGGGGVDDAGLATSTNVSPGAVSIIGNVLGALGIPGIATAANLGKNVIANTLSGISSSSAAASNQAMMAAQMGLTPAEASTTTGIAATASAVDSLSGAPVGTTAATPGASGTGSSAASAGAAAAAAAASAGLSSEAQGAAAQAAANAVLGGSSASEASQAGATAATATGNASDPDGTVGGGGGFAGADPGGMFGGAQSGDVVYAKGGLVKKRISKKTGNSTSLVARRK